MKLPTKGVRDMGASFTPGPRMLHLRSHMDIGI